MKLSYALVGAVLMSGVFAATQAIAEDPHHDDHHAAPQGGGHGGPPPGGHGGAPPAGGHPGGAAPGGHPGGAMSGPPRGGNGPAHGNSMMGPSRNTSHGNNTMMMGGHNAMTGHNAPNRNFDRHSYQRNFVAPRRYHANGGYVRPHGWYEHRWVFGEILPALFWSQNYWLNDYNDYGLSDPPPGFVWVRYGSDALLIDQNSGEVLQVEYDVFY
jgi:Ni/Co efflux regulator RcnB